MERLYLIFTPYSKMWKQKYAEQKIGEFPLEKYFSNLLKIEPRPIPALKEIGFEKTWKP